MIVYIGNNHRHNVNVFSFQLLLTHWTFPGEKRVSTVPEFGEFAISLKKKNKDDQRPNANSDLMVAHGVAVDKGVELQLLLVVEDHLQELPVRVAGVSVSQNLDGQDGHYHQYQDDRKDQDQVWQQGL